MRLDSLHFTLAASGYEQGATMVDAGTLIIALGLLVMGVGLLVSKPKAVESSWARRIRQGLGLLLSLGAVAFPLHWFLTR